MIAGIIAEYNIFHNGHSYMLQEVKKHADYVVAVMSGSFVQRGDAAIADKWSRARKALINGVDLVLELPVCYALNAAQSFAEGGVNTLSALGVTDMLAFGSESGDIELLWETARAMEKESGDVSEKVRSFLSEGMSYPSALAKAHGKGNLLSSPNNILAVEYIRALMRSGNSMRPFTVRREGANHDGTGTRGDYASASRIRKMLLEGEDASRFVPYSLSDIRGALGYDISRLDSAVIAKLRASSPEEISRVNEMSEGLHNRIVRAAMETDSFAALCEKSKSKRYTMSRIRRAVIASLIGFTKDIYSSAPEYVRVLGMNSSGAKILKMAKKRCFVPIITKAADFKEKSAMFDLDVRATDLHALCAPSASDRIGGKDFTTSPVIVK